MKNKTILCFLANLIFSAQIFAVDVIENGGFEQGLPPASVWLFTSTFNGVSHWPLCSTQNGCNAAGSGRGGSDSFAWIGGVASGVTSSVSQTISIHETATTLTLWVEQAVCDDANDLLHISLDAVDIGVIACVAQNGFEYFPYFFSVDGYNDGGSHVLSIGGTVGGTNGGHTNFFVDDISLFDDVVFKSGYEG